MFPKRRFNQVADQKVPPVFFVLPFLLKALTDTGFSPPIDIRGRWWTKIVGMFEVNRVTTGFQSVPGFFCIVVRMRIVKVARFAC